MCVVSCQNVRTRMTIPVLLVNELFALGKKIIPRVITLKLCCIFTIHLSKYDKFKCVVSLFYFTPFKSYGPDFHSTTDIKDRFRTRGQFANQSTNLDLHAVESRYCTYRIGLYQ